MVDDRFTVSSLVGAIRLALLTLSAVTAACLGCVAPLHGSDDQLVVLATRVANSQDSTTAALAGVRSPLRQLSAPQACIVRVLTDGTHHVLTEGFHSACDPAVSFDARRMLFAAKRLATDSWSIYEMSLDSMRSRQITTGDQGNCRQPSYQATLYTIVSPEPWYQLTFVSDMAGETNEAGVGAATSLYSCRLDGSEVRRLSYNLSDDADPFLMLDGRLLYARWQRGTFDHGMRGRVSLFGINTDGTDDALFGDVSGLPIKRMPCVTERGLVVFIESEFGGDGSGQISSLSFRRPLHSYRPITTATDGFVYRDPSPWPGGRVLVSRRAQEPEATYGLTVFNPKTGDVQRLLDAAGHSFYQPVACWAMREPDGRSSVVNEEDPHGKLYCLDVNVSDFTDPDWRASNAPSRVRFLEGVALNVDDKGETLRSGTEISQCVVSTRNGLSPLAQRRILGEVDIRADGSFNVELPANTAVQIQTVDENGVALRTCGWVWAKNCEPRGCIGCHEDGELTPENRLVDAMKGPSIALTLPPQRRRTVDFRRDVMPIIEGKCVGCHGAGGALPRLDGGEELDAPAAGTAQFNRAYRNLLVRQRKPDSNSYGGKYVEPGRARRSPVIWHVFGRNLARPWDGTTMDRPVKPIPNHRQRVPEVTEGERRTLVEWVDMGALWDGIPGGG